MITETLWIGDYKVQVSYSIEQPEPDIGIVGGIVLHSCDQIGQRYSALGDKVTQEELEEAVLKELREDLLEDNRY